MAFQNAIEEKLKQRILLKSLKLKPYLSKLSFKDSKMLKELEIMY